jgi:epoxide hydrolase-like predicted phosphatase
MVARIKTKAMLFDFHGVLVFRKDGCCPNCVVDEIDQTIGGVVDDRPFKAEVMAKYKLGEKEFDEMLDKIVEKYERFPAMWDLLPELRKKYKLAIINNGTFLTVPKFDRKHAIYNNFDLFLSSAKEGIKKPDTRIFKLAAQRLSVVPEECLFMDDAKINIDGAKAIGMQTIWWENKEIGYAKFIEFLK